MILEKRIIATMTFRGDAAEADRDQWYDAIRQRVLDAKNSGTFPEWEQAHMSKDDYQVPERITEAL